MGAVAAPGPAASALLGRDDAVAEVARLLHVARLVTLTGPPGIGKSRLALGVAELLGGGHPGGARVVQLDSVTRADDVPRTVAAALSIDEVPGEGLTETLAARLRRRPVLLVLDDCEHLVDSCAGLVEELLAGAAELRLLATSRQPLGLGAERIWQVPPLSVPAPGEDASPEELVRYPSVLLFLARAGAVHPGFALSPRVACAVAEICRRLDGIPLAIELAAARTASLAPEEIVHRLDRRFALLTTGGRDRLPRHRTLAAALDWSYDLLSREERTLVRRLSVFAGGFDVEAAVAVGMLRGVDELPEREIADLLERLVAKSLVVADARGGRQTRYRLLETIRDYAADRLAEAEETDAVKDAHARFHLELAERAEPELTGRDQEHWLERLEAAHANLRSALGRFNSRGEGEPALRMSAALVLFWRVRCHFSEGREALEAALEISDGAPPKLRATALWGVGFMAHMAGDCDAAVAALDDALALFRTEGDRRGCARVLLVLGNCRQFRADPAAVRLLAESAALAREAGDGWCLGHALALSGFEQLTLGRLREARAPFEEALAVARAAGDKQALRLGLIGLGSVCVRQGDHWTAQSLLEEALAITGELGEDYGKATALRFLGELALERGDYREAVELLDRSLALFREAAPPAKAIEPLMLLARTAQAQGDPARARALFEEALALTGENGTFTAALQGLGEIAIAEGHEEEGVRLLARARDLARQIEDKRSAADALHALAQVARGAGRHARATALHTEALELRRDIGAAPGIVASLEALGGLAAAAGRHRHAARLLGAAEALRAGGGFARAPSERARYQADIALVRDGLPAGECETAFAEGVGLSLEAAVTQALKGRRRRGRPGEGWPSLTDREREVAALVAEGLTNPEIAERLFLTTGTVKTHLSHIFKKLGVTNRRELEREVIRRREPPARSRSDSP